MQGGPILGREVLPLTLKASYTLTSIPNLGLKQLPRSKYQQLQPLLSLTFWKGRLECKQILLSRCLGPCLTTL